eukprot:scaffold148919_cov35-Tisochrysis_lutea.AAC.2
MPFASRVCGSEPGNELKSPAVTTGIVDVDPECCVIMRSISRRRCCVCQSFTSANSGDALMCVLATRTCRRKPVEHGAVVGVALSGNGVKLNLELTPRHDGELVAPIEDRTAIHLTVLPHKFTGLAFVDTCVVVLGELRLEKVLEVIRLYLLQAHDIGTIVDKLAQDVAPAVVPRKRPGGTVRVSVGRGVNLREHIVGEQREA